MILDDIRRRLITKLQNAPTVTTILDANFLVLNVPVSEIKSHFLGIGILLSTMIVLISTAALRVDGSGFKQQEQRDNVMLRCLKYLGALNKSTMAKVFVV